MSSVSQHARALLHPLNTWKTVSTSFSTNSVNCHFWVIPWSASWLFFSFLVAPTAWGSSRARDQIWASAQPMPQLRQCGILNPQCQAGDQTQDAPKMLLMLLHHIGSSWETLFSNTQATLPRINHELGYETSLNKIGGLKSYKAYSLTVGEWT